MGWEKKGGGLKYKGLANAFHSLLMSHSKGGGNKPGVHFSIEHSAEDFTLSFSEEMEATEGGFRHPPSTTTKSIDSATSTTSSLSPSWFQGGCPPPQRGLTPTYVQDSFTPPGLCSSPLTPTAIFFTLSFPPACSQAQVSPILRKIPSFDPTLLRGETLSISLVPFTASPRAVYT